MEEETDSCFFPNALQIAIRTHDVSMVQRLEALYSRPTNRVKLIPFTTESWFYNIYLMFHLRHLDSVEDFYRVYSRVVPRLTTPTRKLTQEAVEKILASDSYYFPLVCKLIEDNMNHAMSWSEVDASLYRRLLHEVDTAKLSPDELSLYGRVTERLLKSSLAYAVIEHALMEDMQKPLPITAALEYAELLLFKANYKERAWNLLSMLLTERALGTPAGEKRVNAIISNNLGESNAKPWKETLCRFFDRAMSDGEVENALTCLSIVHHYFPPQSASDCLQLLVAKAERLAGDEMSFEQKARIRSMKEAMD